MKHALVAARLRYGVLALTLSLAGYAQAQQPVKIGFITTLSTPAGYIGEDERDGFLLAVKEEGGKLGGIPVSVQVEDDALKPASGKQIADKMLQDGVKLFTGINFSNVLLAVAPSVISAGGTYVSNNPGPSNFAGKGCHPNFFGAGFQNDSMSDTVGMAANDMGIKKAVIMVPSYQAGRDAAAGFKRTFKGEILGEIYTKLDQSDFSVELARIRTLNPDALFQFHPGGTGINLVKQFANSGLSEKIKMITPIYSMDERMLAAVGQAGKGFYMSSLWSNDLDNEPNKQFVDSFTKTYQRIPTAQAAQSYDTAKLIASALKAVDGDIVGKADDFRDALRKADFDSVRGDFKFGPNHFPIQNWYLLQTVDDGKGGLTYKNVDVIAKGHTDIYASECAM
ncbi:ABC transporter substrate-binding protein [Pusillimonas sp. CC-YST705]|uniref:ABC transporter substrate-binding protein n=1 Tax=Mesopusillimonas faecipullorum TaxID=2755040 RepID=A0ABS8CBK5_9BURK|nr:ABC transporter substrate-binding protein [Mesopusillimonas faecipullorum]MCB5363404.1 ABC transporter substrate-binding protein [Mesopusillimonas faecipullorum]